MPPVRNSFTAPVPKNPATARRSDARGGRSTKIHVLVDALGNRVGLFLTGGPAHGLLGADHLLTCMQAGTLIADKAYGAWERVPIPPAAADGTAVIPPKANHRAPRRYDRHLYKGRRRVEDFFAKLKRYRAIATSNDRVATLESPSACSPSSIIRPRESGHASGSIWLDTNSFRVRRSHPAARRDGTRFLEQNDEGTVGGARDKGMESIFLL